MERIAPLYSCLYFSALPHIDRSSAFFFLNYKILYSFYRNYFAIIWPKLEAYQPFHAVLNTGSWPIRLFGAIGVTSFVLQLIDVFVFTFVPALCGIHQFIHLYATVYGIHRLFTDSHICYRYQLVSRLNLQTPNVNYSWRNAPLTSKIAFYIFIQQIQVPNILNMVYTLRFFLFKMQFVS